MLEQSSLLTSHLGKSAQPLIYVQRFRPFCRPDPYTCLYKAYRYSIVSAKTVLRSCHLIPKYGIGDVDRLDIGRRTMF